MVDYTNTLLTAREAADKRLAKLSPTRTSELRQSATDITLPSGSGFIARRMEDTATGVEDGYLTQYFTKIREENKSMRDLLAERFEEQTFGTDTVSKDTGVAPGYTLSKDSIMTMIEEEAGLRNVDSKIALSIYRNEGYGSYQSNIKRKGKGSKGGKEASYGPFQLFTGGGLGTEYEEATKRTLAQDNTEEGIRKQIQFALDKAAEKGNWNAWYGREAAGVGVNEGLEDARPIYNWKEE